MMKKLKINDFCSIRVDGPLYCLSDLYNVMDMRNDRAAPQHWALDRVGIPVRKHGLFRKARGPGPGILQKGWFRKTYWGPASVLVGYAASLTPVTERDVRAAVNMSIEKPEVREPLKPLNARIIPSSLPKEQPPLTRADLFVAPDLPVEQGRIMQDGSTYHNQAETERLIARAQKAQRPHSPGTRAHHQGHRGSRSSQSDAMMAQMLIMNSVLSEPSRSVDVGSCDAPSRSSHSSYSDDSSRHSSHSSHSSHDYGSYDSGSSSDSGGSSGCD